MKHSRLIRIVVATMLVGLTFSMPTIARHGFAGNSGIVPPHARAYGNSYGEWAQGWMQWTLGISADQNPITDETGEFCDVGQEGKVWYLTGSFGDVVTAGEELPLTVRECTVPKGKAIFFPVVLDTFFRTNSRQPTDPDVIRELLLGCLNTAYFACEIDGRPVENLERYITESPIFDLVLPDDNLWAPYVPGGICEPACTMGYFLMLAPLSEGEHTIRIEYVDDLLGDGTTWWGYEVVYELTVIGKK